MTPAITRASDPSPSGRRTTTLLHLVMELANQGASDGEVVAAVMDLIETGRIRLVGEICEPDLRPQCHA